MTRIACAAIIINSKAFAMLYSAIQTGNTSYDPLDAMQLIYTNSRDDTTFYTYLYPLLSEFMTEVTSQVGRVWAGVAFQNASDPAVLQNI
jgi:hypothetical protein